jgi:hypothetical protein
VERVVRVSVPAGIANALAVIFSMYHLLLGVTSLGTVTAVAPVITCMVLYAAATAAALLPRGAVLPMWASCFALATVCVMPIVIAPQLPNGAANAGYATWYVAAIGTLMVILTVRGRIVFGWVGVVFLAVQTVLVLGPGALASTGVIGDLTWVFVSTMFSNSVNTATRATRDFVRAEQETADWQAAQDAHVHERQFRLQQTTRMALPMLERIIASCGDLTPAERAECLHLEGAIRDEIRGRSLLSDDVRHEVMVLRRQGATVQLLDEGGLDDLDVPERDRVHGELADALRRAAGSDSVIVRTVGEGSETAVTVVGLRLDTRASEATALGMDAGEDDDEDDSVVLWLEIQRHPSPVA